MLVLELNDDNLFSQMKRYFSILPLVRQNPGSACLALTGWLLILLCFATTVLADGPAARIKYSKSCQALFDAGKYSELESIGQDLRSNDVLLTEGLWKLGFYYEGIELSASTNGPKADDYLKGLNAWETLFPDSLSLPVLRASYKIKLAWAARGSGYANTVTDKGWEIFRKEIQEARNILDAAKKRGEVCPGDVP
jgi:hypothetical protein